MDLLGKVIELLDFVSKNAASLSFFVLCLSILFLAVALLLGRV